MVYTGKRASEFIVVLAQFVWFIAKQGIVSLSPRRLSTSYCDPKKYTIFTKVGIYVKWIQHVLEKVHVTHNYTLRRYQPILESLVG
jgi:hypothetical protein